MDDQMVMIKGTREIKVHYVGDGTRECDHRIAIEASLIDDSKVRIFVNDGSCNHGVDLSVSQLIIFRDILSNAIEELLP